MLDLGRKNEFDDIVVWGATGFVGRLVASQLAEYAAEHGSLVWAIGGRSRSKLEALRSSVGVEVEVPMIVGDSHDTAAMRRAGHTCPGRLLDSGTVRQIWVGTGRGVCRGTAPTNAICRETPTGFATND